VAAAKILAAKMGDLACLPCFGTLLFDPACLPCLPMIPLLVEADVIS